MHFTEDGHPVLIHDDTVDRTTDGTGRVDRTVESFHPENLRLVRSLAPRARTALITATPVSAARAAGLGDAVIPSLKVTTRERVRQWHRAGLEVWPWTADEEAQWRHARSTGVDGVLTNRTGAYQDWLRASCR